MRLKSALRRGVAAAVIAGIVVSSGIPAYAKTWNIADGDITVKGASDESGNYNNVKQGEKDFEKDEGETVITGESKEHTVTIDTSEGNVDVTFDDLKIDVSGKKEGDVSGDGPVDAGKAAVTVQGDHDAAIELDGANELKSGSCNAGLEKNGHESSGKLTIKDDNGKDGSLTAEGGDGGAGIGGGAEKTIMTFAFFAVLIPLVASILTKLMHSSSNLMLADASFTAIEEMLAEKPLAETKKQPVPQNGEIRLDHVSFQYEAGVKALDDVSLTIRPGTVTALVGESGGGKSTVANLIARFWDVSEGSVTVGGVDVRELDYADWMKHISIVFQDTNLFKMSVAENVSMYKPGASREEIMEALRQARCEDILEKLPNGVDSVIGARGVYLSGGEMQRIALARAILKDAPIVLLDEATAFADAENEYLIQRALDILLHGKTVLMIAHRLQTIVHADQIIVMQRGGIAEQGTHEELMQRQGVYAKMYHEYENSVSWKIGGLA